MKTKITETKVGNIFVENGKFTLDPWCGSRINHVCEIASQWTSLANKGIEFNFNGILITATPGDSSDSLCQSYETQSEQRSKDYQESPAGKAAAEENRKDIFNKQLIIDRLVSKLPIVIDDEFAILKWACAVEHNSRIGVKCNYRALGEALGSRWPNNAHVGKTPEEINASPQITAEYIMGQVVNCLLMGTPPHPMVNHFYEQYLAAKQTAVG